jgi:hypothetical protein
MDHTLWGNEPGFYLDPSWRRCSRWRVEKSNVKELTAYTNVAAINLLASITCRTGILRLLGEDPRIAAVGTKVDRLGVLWAALPIGVFKAGGKVIRSFRGGAFFPDGVT